MIVILPPVAISHYKLDKAVFKKKRYLEYFKEFEKKDEKWHKKWKRLTNVFLLGSIITTGIGLIIVFIINGMISI